MPVMALDHAKIAHPRPVEPQRRPFYLVEQRVDLALNPLVRHGERDDIAFHRRDPKGGSAAIRPPDPSAIERQSYHGGAPELR